MFFGVETYRQFDFEVDIDNLTNPWTHTWTVRVWMFSIVMPLERTHTGSLEPNLHASETWRRRMLAEEWLTHSPRRSVEGSLKRASPGLTPRPDRWQC